MMRKINVIRIAILFVCVGMITYGSYRSEVDTVFKKAVNICLECIGIG